ncbi:MAG: hypothetical protein FWG44_05410 [Oscillospiraceae bacterium]|nr:hypothetical protein [Oscillospiraceae bacterium]
MRSEDLSLDFLLNNACTSIVMKTREEIIKEKIPVKEKKSYLNQIISGEKINTVLSWQGADGYFGTRFHTPPSNSKIWAHEGCVRCLLETGLGLDFEPLKKAFDVLLAPGWGKECEETKNKTSAVFGYSMIRASLFAQAGLHEHEFVSEWTEIALQSFRNLAEASDYSDIAVPYKDKFIFIGNQYLPTIYLLRILAFTNKWRTPENIAMTEKAYRKLYKWLPFPPTYIKAKSQLVAPAGNIAGKFNQNINEQNGVWWFFFYELSARMGLLGKKSPFYKHLLALNKNLNENNGLFIEKYNKRGYINWSGYSGIALEDNWTKKERRICDLTFRSCLINAISKNI